MSHVFISYVHEDEEPVRRLCVTLQAYDIKVWLDREQLKPGYRWADAIQRAIREGTFYIACFSSVYNQRSKTYMNEELTLAIEELRQRPTHIAWFIPVLLDNCEVPDHKIGAGETLRSLQWVKLHDNWNVGIKDILSVIQPNSAKVYELTQKLGNKSARVRIKAADDLGLLGGVADVAVPALIQLLDDENDTVCAAAADALGRIGKATEQVIAKLLATIKRANLHYAGLHAIHALAKLGKPAIAPLLDALHSNSIDILTLYSILSKIHDPDAIPELTEAFVALGKIGDPVSISVLKNSPFA